MTVESVAGGRYVIDQRLGAGGMAVVYRATDTELDRRVAVKVMAEHLAADAEFRERFLREARTVGALSHPNIVQVFDGGEIDGRPYIVMEYIEGVTLGDELARRKRFSVDDAVELAVQACAGLEHAHAAGLVHRDIKPQNLILRPDGMLKIADFGIARTVGGTTQLTAVGTVLGTAAYLAPEQAAGEQVTSAADIYALGAVLYELIAGQPPYPAANVPELVAKQRTGRVRSLRDFNSEVPPALEEVVLRCLAPEPAARPLSAAALARELGATPERTTVVARPAQFRSRRRLWPAAAALALIILALVLALGRNGGETAPPAQLTPVPEGASSAEDARNLADWIRDHSG